MWQGSPKALLVTGTLQLCLPIHNFVTTVVAFAASHELLRLNAALHFTHVGNFPTSAGQSGVPKAANVTAEMVDPGIVHLV